MRSEPYEPVGYILTHRATGLFYIGSTTDKFGRTSSHLSRLRNGNHHVVRLQRAYDDHEDKSIDFSYFPAIDEDSALNIEQELLNEYEHNENLTNRSLCSRSSTGVIPGFDTRVKMSAARFGATHTEETKDKISQAHLGRMKSEQHCASLSIAQKKLAETKEGHERLVALAMSKAKPVIIDGVVFDSVHSAARHFELAKPSVLHRINSKTDKFKNWNWA